jgi:hypothetical protein
VHLRLRGAALGSDTGVFILTHGRVRYVAHASKAMTYLGQPVTSIDLKFAIDAGELKYERAH